MKKILINMYKKTEQKEKLMQSFILNNKNKAEIDNQYLYQPFITEDSLKDFEDEKSNLEPSSTETGK